MKTFSQPNLDPAKEPLNFTIAAESLFAGNRSVETDNAWNDLLANINIRVSADELSAQNLTSVPLPRGGYLAWPEALHQLHCVKRIRKWVYREQYLPHLGPDEEQHWLVHMDHCIELLRQAIMCRPDTALMGFHSGENAAPTLDLRGPEHVCTDWKAYVEELRKRKIASEEMLELRRATP
ncbi:MAG: hypothetical protein Q9159_002463 [Coniocarpon cinnabarinum]